MEKYTLLNTPSEIGLRCLFLLQEAYPTSYNVEKIMYLDYLTIYSRDAQILEDSLHPEYPMRELEIFSKQVVFREALLLMASKKLLDITYDEMGIRYKANINTKWILAGIENSYSIELSKKIKIVNKKFQNESENKIRGIIESGAKEREEEITELL